MSKITLSKLYEMKKSGEKIVMITAYDALFAKIFDDEVDMVLVGDSLNMSFGGHSETLGASVEQMIYHACAVRRGLKRAYMVVDMPFCSCATPELALQNCAKVYESTGCDAVKIEGGAHMAGESLLIGGMTREKSSEGVTKVPFLGDIPVLGNLFKTTERGGEHKERLFLISPRLVPARRALSGTAPVGPQRPGNAVQAPPMPELEPKPDTAQEKKDEAAAPKSRFLMPASGEASIGQTY